MITREDKRMNQRRNATTYRCRRCDSRLLLPIKKSEKNKKPWSNIIHYCPRRRHRLSRMRRHAKKLGMAIFAITKSILICVACILQVDKLF
jgi:hypothetical protein